MIKRYKFDYDYSEADASFKVDTEIFTKEMAQVILDFFTWDYDEEADPIDEVVKKYAIKVIMSATFDDLNVYGVIREFEDREGFCPLDGSCGIWLISVSGYEFNEDKLEVTIKINA